MTKIEQMDEYIKDMLLSEMDKAYIGKAYLSVFTIGFTIVDYMASLCKISNPLCNPKKYNIGENFTAFVEKYLKDYDPEALYIARCKLLHCYQTGESEYSKIEYIYTKDAPIETHLTLYKNNKTIIKVENFKLDINNAWNLLKNDALKDNTLLEKIYCAYGANKSIRLTDVTYEGKNYAASGGF